MCVCAHLGVCLHRGRWLSQPRSPGFQPHGPLHGPPFLPCSFTCPHPDIFVPQSGLRQLVPPPLLPIAPPLPGSMHVVPPDPHLAHSPLSWGPLSPSPQPFLHGDTQVPLPPGSFFLARPASHPSSRLIPHLLTGHTPCPGFLQAPPGAFKDQWDLTKVSGADRMSCVRVHPQALPGARHVLGAQ